MVRLISLPERPRSRFTLSRSRQQVQLRHFVQFQCATAHTRFVDSQIQIHPAFPASCSRLANSARGLVSLGEEYAIDRVSGSAPEPYKGGLHFGDRFSPVVSSATLVSVFR